MKILLGLQSGSGEPLTSEDWRMIRQEVQKRHQERCRKKS
jgi:hypothetical protein